MAKQPIQMSLANVREFEDAMKALPVELRTRGLKDALRRAGRLVVGHARRLAPVDTGTLKKSLGLILRTPRRGRNRDPYVVIGARRGYSRQVTRDGRSMKATPANYAHLVELGHHISTGGTLFKVGGGRSQRRSRTGRTGKGTAILFVLARPFLRPAFSGSRGAVLSDLVSSLSTFQQREAARIARRLARKKG